ncbi:SDR family NAD(P)-dependent oxidoreductase, partial [Streptomyces sp. NPDC094472]|uniref:SDR family NAD(P)-dependent oxidoreductase n=1 Tax=Streptomyces sp. NPDC094472 TaxID=3155080 RepID=UPI0033216CD9
MITAPARPEPDGSPPLRLNGQRRPGDGRPYPLIRPKPDDDGPGSAADTIFRAALVFAVLAGVRETSSTSHVALVTGANQGIGAATARALAARGVAVLCTYLRPRGPGEGDAADPYHAARSIDGEEVAAEIRRAGGRAEAFEANLSDPAVAGRLFDVAEDRLGPVDILVNNASGWIQDTFTPDPADRFDRPLRPVTAQTWSRQFAVDAMAPALLIGELARRHRARGADWGRIVGLTSGGDLGFPGEVSYGAAKAAQTDYTLSAAGARYAAALLIVPAAVFPQRPCAATACPWRRSATATAAFASASAST